MLQPLNRQLAISIFEGLYGEEPRRIEADEVLEICDIAARVVEKDPSVVMVSGPAFVVGDLHGQFKDLVRILNETTPWKNADVRMIFLGDYVDRGPNSVDTITLLLALKVIVPDRVFLLRGNHECMIINICHGFWAECETRFGQNAFWEKFNFVFDRLPLCAIVNDAILCVHAGISEVDGALKIAKEQSRPFTLEATGALSDLLWSDPSTEIDGFAPNTNRGQGCTFGAKALEEFLTKNKLELLVRSHEVVDDGFEEPFRGCVTIFSSSDYGGNGQDADQRRSHRCEGREHPESACRTRVPERTTSRGPKFAARKGEDDARKRPDRAVARVVSLWRTCPQSG
jgi:diadenosine tetraphosphatase ApaH/serine/threonine PP2A family protein phosphatase